MPTCSECGNPCDAIVIDDGIGPYEYFGMKGVDRRPALVSDCCEADPLDDAGHSIQLSDLEPPEC